MEQAWTYADFKLQKVAKQPDVYLRPYLRFMDTKGTASCHTDRCISSHVY